MVCGLWKMEAPQQGCSAFFQDICFTPEGVIDAYMSGSRAGIAPFRPSSICYWRMIPVPQDPSAFLVSGDVCEENPTVQDPDDYEPASSVISISTSHVTDCVPGINNRVLQEPGPTYAQFAHDLDTSGHELHQRIAAYSFQYWRLRRLSQNTLIGTSEQSTVENTPRSVHNVGYTLELSPKRVPEINPRSGGSGGDDIACELDGGETQPFASKNVLVSPSYAIPDESAIRFGAASKHCSNTARLGSVTVIAAKSPKSEQDTGSTATSEGAFRPPQIPSRNRRDTVVEPDSDTSGDVCSSKALQASANLDELQAPIPAIESQPSEDLSATIDIKTYKRKPRQDFTAKETLCLAEAVKKVINVWPRREKPTIAFWKAVFEATRFHEAKGPAKLRTKWWYELQKNNKRRHGSSACYSVAGDRTLSKGWRGKYRALIHDLQTHIHER